MSPVAIRVSPGSEMPLHSTAAGKVLLASLDDGDARKLLGRAKLAAITPHTITEPAASWPRWPRCGGRAIATVNEENIPGVLSVGAPITRSRAAMSWRRSAWPFPSISKAGLTLQGEHPLVTGAALRISRALGGGELGTASAMRLTAIGERYGGKR